MPSQPSMAWTVLHDSGGPARRQRMFPGVRTEADFCGTSTLQWEPYEQPPNLFCSPPCCSLRKSSSPIRPAPAAARGTRRPHPVRSIDRDPEGPDLSGAVLQDAAGVQAFYRLREQLPDGSQIVKIRSDSILLKQTDGTLHEVFITQDNKKALQAPASGRLHSAEPGGKRSGPGEGPANTFAETSLPLRATRNNDNKRRGHRLLFFVHRPCP